MLKSDDHFPFFAEYLGMAEGTIKKLVSDKGFGFIEGECGELFFHHSAVKGTPSSSSTRANALATAKAAGPRVPALNR